MRARSSVSFLALLACLGCEPQARPQAQALTAVQAPDAVLLDERAGARLIGRILPAPEGADPERWLEVTLERDGARAPIEGRVLDARFVGEAVVVIDAAHELRVLGGPVLDHSAEPPLSVRGSRVAYVRGEMPFFEVALADVSTGSSRGLTEGYAPAWSPALDADGSVVFVSSRDGRPRLHRVSGTGQVQALPISDRTPSSPRPPRVEHGQLTFEDELGAGVIDLATGRVLEGGAP